MGLFSTPGDRQRADWPLLRHGAITLFHGKRDWRRACNALQAIGYHVTRISAAQGRAAFLAEVTEALQWQEMLGYGPWSGNLDALNDALYGFPFDGTPNAALAIADYDVLVAEDPRMAWVVLDIIALLSRERLLDGRLLLGLIQSNDPNYAPEPVGGYRPIRIAESTANLSL